MKNILLYIMFFTNIMFVSAQTFDVVPIKLSPNGDKAINLVVMGDGYQTSELTKFITDATSFSNKMFAQSPFSEYANYFNVYAIKVPSNQSGADHPGTATDVTEPYNIPVITKDTYFNATYDSYGFHRLLYYEIDGNSANNTAVKINTVLANNFPNYDQVLIIVNSDEYGGSGGEFPMTYSGFYSSDVAVHEIGHSLFKLIDEYYPIDDALAVEGINMTKETDPNLVRWKNWLNSNGVGIYQYFDDGGNPKPWYRPHQNCKMRFIEKTFCSVCKEGIIEKIHDLVSPIDSYLPNNNTVDNPTFPLGFQLNLIKPIPNTLVSEWTLNASIFGNNVDDVSIEETNLNEGANTLIAVVNDATTLLRVNNHETLHVYTVTWTINYSALGVDDIASEINEYKIKVYPNPTNDIINFKFESLLNTNLKLDIISIDGKKIQSYSLSNSEDFQINMSAWSQGIYIAKFYANHTLISNKKLVKN